MQHWRLQLSKVFLGGAMTGDLPNKIGQAPRPRSGRTRRFDVSLMWASCDLDHTHARARLAPQISGRLGLGTSQAVTCVAYHTGPVTASPHQMHGSVPRRRP